MNWAWNVCYYFTKHKLYLPVLRFAHKITKLKRRGKVTLVTSLLVQTLKMWYRNFVSQVVNLLCTFRKLSSNFGQFAKSYRLKPSSLPHWGRRFASWVCIGGLNRVRSDSSHAAEQDDNVSREFQGFGSLGSLEYARGSPDLVDVEALQLPAFIEELELDDCPELIAVNLRGKLMKLIKKNHPMQLHRLD